MRSVCSGACAPMHVSLCLSYQAFSLLVIPVLPYSSLVDAVPPIVQEPLTLSSSFAGRKCAPRAALGKLCSPHC